MANGRDGGPYAMDEPMCREKRKMYFVLDEVMR